MITLGLILLLVVGGLVVDVVVENGQHTDVAVLHQNLTLDSWAVFVAGAAAALIAAIGFWLLTKGTARDARRRREHRRLLREHNAIVGAASGSVREREPASTTPGAVTAADAAPQRVTTATAPAGATAKPTTELRKPVRAPSPGPVSKDSSASPGSTEAMPAAVGSAPVVTEDASSTRASRTGVFSRPRR
jgi:hypothetical protein